MSKAIRQSITLLSVIGGCLHEINEARLLSRLDLRELVDNTYREVVYALKEWPKDQDDIKIIKWVDKKIFEWKTHVKEVDSFHRLVVFTKICERCMADLLDKNKSSYKQQLLRRVQPNLTILHDFTDPEGGNFPAYAKSDELMDFLYTLIEWE